MPTGMLVVIGLCIAAVLLGIGVIWHARRQRARALASRNWPTTPATIVSSQVGTRSDSESVTHVAMVTYTYRVSGRDYQCNRLSFGGNVEGPQQDMVALVAEFPVGKQVPAHYDPENPPQAVLRPDILSVTNAIFWGGVLMIGIGVAIGGMLVWRVLVFGSL